MKTNFKDKTIWITGASSGIGAALAIQFNALGAKVIVSARRIEKLINLKSKCKFKKALIPISLDIKDQEGIDFAVSEVKKMGPLHLMIHNAGIAQKGLVINTSLNVDRDIMETNYFGTIALTKAVLPIFIKQKTGWFAIVSSISGVVGIPGRSAYAASKHALQGFFESLRAENFDCKLNISMIIPGFINTEITLKELCGDGTPYGKFEKSHLLGISAEQCAAKIIRGLERKRNYITIGKFELVGIYIHRISRILYNYLIKQNPMKRWRNFMNYFEVKQPLLIQKE